MVKRWFPVFVLILFTLACSLPTAVKDNLTPEPGATSTPAPDAQPLSTDTPIPTDTPLPAQRVLAADYAITVGDYLRAIQENQAALAAATDDATRAAALYGIGRGQFFSTDMAGAANTFNQIIQQYPNGPVTANAWYFLAESQMNQEQYAAAADSYAQYVSLRPGVLDATMHEKRGDALLRAGRSTDALTAYQAARSAPQLQDLGLLDLKIGEAYAAGGDYDNAVRTFLALYDSTSNDYIKASADLQLGHAYLGMNLPEQGYARFQDAVNNFPLSYDSYRSLVALVENHQPVNEFNRGRVDYYAGQYAVAVEAFDRYEIDNPEHDGTLLHFRALARQALGNAEAAAADWQALINGYGSNTYWAVAHEDLAYTYWAYLNKYPEAAQVLLNFVQNNPNAAEASDYLYQAARVLERNDQLEEAAQTWERMINEYPSAELSLRGLFLAGVTNYRLLKYDQALLNFQRFLVLAVTPGDQAAAYLWIGKAQTALGDTKAASASWQQAAQRDPTGYFSERARELLDGTPPLFVATDYNLDVDLGEERRLAEVWVKSTFSAPEGTTLNDMGPLAADARVIRGDALWEVNEYDASLAEYEALRQQTSTDGIASFRLMNHLLALGYNRQAITVSRQILTLANLDDLGTFTAPSYFNHIRFGVYYRDLLLTNAAQEGFHPLFLLSVMRQESLFDGVAHSSAGARGLMQIIPATGQEVASELGWPAGYTDADLYRPMVNVRFGSHYLARQRNYFNGDLYVALAAYNGGPGNAAVWQALSGGDPDLFLEIIRASESRDYIMRISENLHIYKRLYEPVE